MPPTPPLLLPEPPDRVPALGSPSDTLVHVGRAGRRPFLAASAAVAVHGDELDGVDRVVAGGAEALRSLRTGAGRCSNILSGPRGFRRELVGPGGTVLETLVVSDGRPGVVIQWSTPRDDALALDVRWEIAGPVAAHRSTGALLRVRPERGPDRIFAVLPAPLRWELDAATEPSHGLTVRVRVRAQQGPITLIAAALDRDDDGSELVQALTRTPALEARAHGFAERVRRDLLATGTGVREIDDGLAWAVARTVDARRPAADAESLGVVWQVAGALAAGCPDAAVRWLSPPEDPAGVLALGWWMRWTGDGAPLRRYRDGVLDVLAPGGARGASPAADEAAGSLAGGAAGRRVVLEAAREAAAEGFEAMGDGAAAARIRDTGPPRPPREPAPSRDDPPVEGPASQRGPAPVGGGRALPMLGGGSGAPRGSALLAAVLGVAQRPPSGPESGSPAAAADQELVEPHPASLLLRAWGLWAVDRPDEAYPLLRRYLAERAAAPARPDPGAALTPATVVYGLLGGRAEAAWGRLRLAPALPSAWARFEVTGIRVGDARVDLRYARRGGTHTFTLEQTTGRVPLNLVFEPSVPARVEAVRVDGAATDVVPEKQGRRGRVRLQLPLDAERTVTLAGSDS